MKIIWVFSQRFEQVGNWDFVSLLAAKIQENILFAQIFACWGWRTVMWENVNCDGVTKDNYAFQAMQMGKGSCHACHPWVFLKFVQNVVIISCHQCLIVVVKNILQNRNTIYGGNMNKHISSKYQSEKQKPKKYSSVVRRYCFCTKLWYCDVVVICYAESG